MLQVLSRYYVHHGETPAELETLARTAKHLMNWVLRPLGSVLTTLPIGPSHPGRTAGPASRSPGPPTSCCPTASPHGRSLPNHTGGITTALKSQVRIHARSSIYPDRPQAAGLMEYCIARGADLGPVGEDFGRACSQIDRADVMLAGLHERVRQGLEPPEWAWPETDGPQIIAMARPDPDSQTVSLILDATTANIAMFAIAAHAEEREAQVREVERFGERLPEDSYGRRNRQAIAARETRIAARLRAVEHAYRTANERDIVIRPPNPHQHIGFLSMRSTGTSRQGYCAQ
jgi:hypothetical protein